ncbi:hypothetical protein SAMN05216464_1359 [Mucilaginibacter pineti]|uniref:GLPGLI family protein n=1 Tax=Mucilaginibacter pineti TaxID=1391627 RepID=A0A1G7P667_9SPHI|nr:hypothetical protein [Mucilaginibacter pineti]SDF81637.1 hypothetical protein SAMN05216464_1359 [Mucilaginibacter pineti]
MKNKWALLSTLIFCICIFCDVNGQTPTSSVTVIRGYVVMQFDKQDVLNHFTTKSQKSIPIDSYKQTFFLPFGKATLDINTDSLNILHHDNIVFLPSKETNELITEFCKDKAYLIKNDFPTYKGDATYFEVKGKSNEKYLYKYYFIECKAIRATIPNTSKNAFKLNILYNKSTANLECNFVFDTVVLQPIDAVNSKNIRPFDVTQKIAPHEAGHILPKN